jgi:hypothetical protein
MAGLVPAIYVFVRRAPQDVDARDEHGHDDIRRHRAPGRLTRKEKQNAPIAAARFGLRDLDVCLFGVRRAGA